LERQKTAAILTKRNHFEEAPIMTEQTEHNPTAAGAVPARIALEDFIEAVALGVARALAAEDEVSGYVQMPAGKFPQMPAGTFQAFAISKDGVVVGGYVGRDPIPERPY
jgi:hypothetical protein